MPVPTIVKVTRLTENQMTSLSLEVGHSSDFLAAISETEQTRRSSSFSEIQLGFRFGPYRGINATLEHSVPTWLIGLCATTVAFRSANLAFESALRGHRHRDVGRVSML